MSSEKSVVRFLLNNCPQAIDLGNHPSYRPTTTLLSYLRSMNDHKGVKEGCAEGDCGACTVVVAFPISPTSLKYIAVNSCLVFLPWIHGKQLITVEGLSDGPVLHPVQQLLVDHYGSQCGFCTPGIILSLFALYRNYSTPNRQIAIEALSGNLCRCTGYQPILEVALKAMVADKDDKFSRNEQSILDFLLPLQSESLLINNGKQRYLRPSTLEETLKLRHSNPEACIVSGATDIAIRQSKKYEFLPEILDISGIGELQQCKKDPAGLRIGSGVSIEEILEHYSDEIPMFKELFGVFASRQIRNLATLGGNIGSASPIGDSLPVLIALNAVLELVSEAGTREVPVEKFITGYRKTLLSPGEIIRSVFIPVPPAGTVFRFYKISKRKELDIATVSLAARIRTDRNNLIEEIVLAFGGMADRPSRAIHTEQYLTGKNYTLLSFEESGQFISHDFSPISDARCGKEGRLIMAQNLLIKFYLETSQDAGNNG